MPEARPRFAPEQEVRFAVVMYGGVSLAIYINGVAQELFRLVRATAPEKPLAREEGAPVVGDERVYFADAGTSAGSGRPALRRSEQVYRELGQQLGIGGLDRDVAGRGGQEPAPVRTRFVIDILSGTSAGGINGVLLAKAIAEQQDFGVSEGLWLQVADIAALLGDGDSWKGLPEGGREPESLLNGHRLFWEACKALEQMGRREIPEDPFLPAYAEQLELNVTATDLLGLSRPVRLRPERIVNENVHRKVFRFEYGVGETLGEDLSDFRDRHDPLLAFAARATSSFPFAFEPVTLDDVDFITKQIPDPGPWFEGYRDPRAVFFADGGYLDNKPFSYATQALRRRRADVPVSRKLVYIEPDPAPDAVAPATTRPERPDVYRNVMDAMGGLPRFEPIRQDIADVTGRNTAIRRLRDLEQRAAAAAATEPAGALPAAMRDTYLSLRLRVVLDALTEVAALLRAWPEDDPCTIEVREKLSEWVDTQSRDELLERLDTPFLHRRSSFLHDRANELLRGGDAEAVALQTFKRALNDAFEPLRRAGRAPRARDLVNALDDADQKDRFEAVREATRALPERLAEYVEAVAAYLDAPRRAAREGSARALDALAEASPAGGRLKALDERFELIDGIVLPLAHPDLGEANAVELWRVSPRDSTGAVPTADDIAADPPRKLAGLRLHHFGAFLDAGYRENDILWGRLDGAEAIMNAVLPGDGNAAAREHFRIAAQAAILREAMPQRLEPLLREELARPQDPANDEALLTAFLERYTAPGDLDDTRKQALARRAIRITSKVLGMRAKERRIPKLPLTLLGIVGPVVVRLVATWRRLTRNPFKRR